MTPPNRKLDVLFPRMRQAISSTLLLEPRRSWYLTELAGELEVTPSSLQRELASLAEARFLERRVEGRKVFFKAATREPLVPELGALLRKARSTSESRA